MNSHGLTGPLVEHFSPLEDPRLDRKKRHNLIDVLVIVICAVICGAETWEEMEIFGKSKIKWFERFLELPNGMPSHDTMNRVFTLINPVEFEKCFIAWMQFCFELTNGEIVPIDGKRIRSAYDHGAPGKSAIHLVSAFSSENGVVLGQVKVEDKTNEITAIPNLLEMLDLKGCIVTIDAMGCQKEIARKIIESEADYVLALKGNQGNLHDDVKLYLDSIADNELKNIPHEKMETIDKGHGRVEERRYMVTESIDWLEKKDEWKNLKSIGMVESVRHIGDAVSTERRYYISSLSGNVEKFGSAVRKHWSIENNLHWSLDVSFGDDDIKTFSGHSAENLAIVRRVAYNLVKQDEKKGSIKGKRKSAGWNNGYLMRLLAKLIKF